MKVKKQDSVFGNQDNDGPNNILRNAGSKLSPEFYKRESSQLERQIRNYKLYYCFVAAYCSLGKLFALPMQLVAITSARNGEKAEHSQNVMMLFRVILLTGFPWILKPLFAWYCDRFFPFRYRIKGYALVISILNIIIMSTVHFTSSVRVFEIAVEIYLFTIVILDTIAQGMMTATISLERRLLEKIYPFTPIRRRRYSQETIKLVDIAIKEKPKEEPESSNSSETLNRGSKLPSIYSVQKPTDDEWHIESSKSLRDQPESETRAIQTEVIGRQGVKKLDFIWEPSYTSNYALYLAAYYFFGYAFTFVGYNSFIKLLQDQDKVTLQDLERHNPPVLISIGCSVVLLVYSITFKELRKGSWFNDAPTRIDLKGMLRMLFRGRPSLLVSIMLVIGMNPLNFIFEKVMLACRINQQHKDMIDIKEAMLLNSPIALTGLVMLVVMIMIRRRIRWAGVRKLGAGMLFAQFCVGVAMLLYSFREEEEVLRLQSFQYGYALASCLIWEGLGAICRICLVERFIPSAMDGNEVFLVNLISAIVSLSRWVGKFLYVFQASLLLNDGDDAKFRYALLIDGLFLLTSVTLLMIYRNTKSETYKVRYSEKTADLLRWKLLEPHSETEEFTIDIERQTDSKAIEGATQSTTANSKLR